MRDGSSQWSLAWTIPPSVRFLASLRHKYSSTPLLNDPVGAFYSRWPLGHVTDW